MNQLVVKSALPDLFLGEGSVYCENLPAPTFIELLRGKLQKEGDITAWNGLDRVYLAFFKELLRGKRRIDWSAFTRTLGCGSTIMLELSDFVCGFIPVGVRNWNSSSLSCLQMMKFLPIQNGDVLIGEMNVEEKVAFLDTVESAEIITGAVMRGDGFDHRTWTPTVWMYWILLWCSVVWRFPKARQLLLTGTYDLEIRDDWKIVACQPRTGSDQQNQLGVIPKCLPS